MQQPNIILMNCDDLGYGDLACYGSQVNKTPHLDKMAEGGMRFTDFYTASPVCSPSRGGMLTGCYPPRIGFGLFDGQWVLFPGQGIGLHEKETTMAQMLREVGYRTALIGKWHCGDQPEFLPTERGFDEYFGLPYSNDMGHQRSVEHNPPLPLIEGSEVIEQQPDQCALTERYVEKAISFMRRSEGQPYFLYFAHMHVHLPLYAAEPFVQSSQNGDFGACVAGVDWSVGCLMHELRRSGQLDNTLFIFTSDNGGRGDHGGSNAPLRGKKGTTWEGGQRVPCIISWPGHVPSGVVCEAPAANIDFFPTFAAVAGAQPKTNGPIDGLDLSGLLFRGEECPRQTFYYYIRNELEAVRVGDWKLHVCKNKEAVCLLYNLRDDVGETQDVAAEHPDVVEQLLAKAEACRQDLGDDATGVKGQNVRPAAQVKNPKPLTEFDANHPYIILMYDKDDVG